MITTTLLTIVSYGHALYSVINGSNSDINKMKIVTTETTLKVKVTVSTL